MIPYNWPLRGVIFPKTLKLCSPIVFRVSWPSTLGVIGCSDARIDPALGPSQFPIDANKCKCGPCCSDHTVDCLARTVPDTIEQL